MRQLFPLLAALLTLLTVQPAVARDRAVVRIERHCAGARVRVGSQGSVVVRKGVAAHLVDAYRAAGVPVSGAGALRRWRPRGDASRPSSPLRVAVHLDRALRAHHPYSSGHCRRVASYVTEIARSMGLDGRATRRMGLAARLHDLGKLGLPRWLLDGTNPRLTPARRRRINGHPELGARLLLPIPGLRGLAIGARSHHENLDGTGYPRGQRGARISFTGRVIAVADAFDAMTSRRTYTEPMSVEQAVATLQRLAGSRFDPAVVKHFVALVDRSPRVKRTIARARQGLR